jgi:maltooligosyltrehalose trehalohydrolase
VGAEVLEGGGVEFRVWAPRRSKVEVVLEGGVGAGGGELSTKLRANPIELKREDGGYFSGHIAEGAPGTLYRYRLDGDGPFPDPASRFQPEGPHGPSRVEDPGKYAWSDGKWRGVKLEGQVLYEMHIGTFTPEGTWASATQKLPMLADTGITVLEVMPVAEFPGEFGWGYDGVDLFAPTRLYGEPDDFRRFVDKAHSLGLGVILDVVYNHLGPSGNYLKSFAEAYFTDRYENEWGEAINFDGEDAGPVREFFIANAAYWIDELHLDGLRLDATQSIHDQSKEHVLAELTRKAREAAPGRSVLIVAENEPQHAKIVRAPEKGGYGMDALWNDDLHHTARVALTGRSEAYYTDYKGSPQELISAVKWGYLYQGQRYAWQKKRRGTPALDLPPAAFVTFIQNHDQIANSARGQRIHALTSPGRHRAMTALLLLAPGTPMLFQGQEFSASSPFMYFADHEPDLAKLVAKGRREFLAQFPSLATKEMKACLADPGDAATFERCKLDWSERERNKEAALLHKDLLRLRREDPVFRAQKPRSVDGAVIASEVLVLRFFGEAGDDRLLFVNLGTDLAWIPSPEPLVAAPEGTRWELLWSSESPRYGGCGTGPVESDEGLFHIPGHAAVVVAPNSSKEDRA